MTERWERKIVGFILGEWAAIRGPDFVTESRVAVPSDLNRKSLVLRSLVAPFCDTMRSLTDVSVDDFNPEPITKTHLGYIFGHAYDSAVFL